MGILKKFEGFTIWSEDHHKLAHWYEEKFDLKVALELDMPLDEAIAFEIEPGNDMYFWICTHSEVHGGNKDPHRQMVSFIVDDVFETEKILKERDVNIFAKAQRSPDGSLDVLTIQDPELNIINLYSKPKD